MILGRHLRFVHRKLDRLRANISRRLRAVAHAAVIRLPLGRPVVRLAEADDSGGGDRASELWFGYQGEALHTSALGCRRSTYRRLYRIIGGGSASRTIEVGWAPSGVSRFEVHGHSVGAYASSGPKVAELEIDSNVPTRISMAKDGEGHPFPLIRISGASIDARLSVRHSQFRIVERSVGLEEGGWKTWQNVLHLNYLLEPPITAAGRKKLTVVFSSLGSDYDFTYNYRSALMGADSYRLFLLDDFGSRGSYYFADHKDLTIYHEVQTFLREVIANLDVSMDGVVFAGSSKGGTGALLHGMGIGVGRIVVGAPQVYPGSYLYKSAPNVLGFITGGRDEEAKNWLDNAVVSRISRPPAGTSVRILVGTKDHHLKWHVQPLLELTSSHAYDIKAIVIPDLSHRNIGSVYRHYLRNMVDENSKSQAAEVLPYLIQPADEAVGKLEVRVWKPKGELIACRLYHGESVVKKTGYSKEGVFTFSVIPGQELKIQIFRRLPGNSQPVTWFFTAPFIA